MKKIALIIGLILLGTVSLSCFVIALAETVPKAAPKVRYISLAPSTTEILFALGLDEEIVGVSSYCNYPQKAQSKEKVGTFSQPNIEKILALKPDYIFCTGLEQAQAVLTLRRLNLETYVSDPVNIQELFNSMRDIGRITHKEEKAANLIKNMEQEIGEISAKVKLIPQGQRLKVFIEIWHDPLTTAGKGSFIDWLLTLAGGINIADDTKIAYSIFSPEEVIKRNPDCIILTYMDEEKPVRLIKERFGWKDISAVKNSRVYNDIDADILLRPGPRVAEAVKEIYQKLYP